MIQTMLPSKALLLSTLFGACNIFLSSLPVIASPAPDDVFQNHGIVAKVSERRGFMAVEDANGKKWVLGFARDMLGDRGARTSLLMIDPESGRTEQFYHPDASTPNGDVFTLFFSSQKKLYATIGAAFVEFDPVEKRFTFVHTKPVPNDQRLGFSMSEAADGKIYFASYPTSMLEVYDPQAKTVEDVVRLDDEQKYPTSLAVAEDGWIYAGLGTTKRSVIAYNRVSGEKRQLVPTAMRENGSGFIVMAADGTPYASFGPEAPYKRPFHRLKDGEVTETIGRGISNSSAAYPRNSLYAFRNALKFSDGDRIDAFDIARRSFIYQPEGGEPRPVAFTYESHGASISALITASNGRIYGSTDHPLQFWEYDPVAGESINHGGIKEIGSGNLTRFVRHGNLLYANSYSGGRFYVFDPALAFQPEDEAKPNPRFLLSTKPDISRPRAIIAHPDGIHLLSAGWPGYGQIGGGLLIYNTTDGTSELIPSEALSPFQSISAMAALPDGNILFGTTCSTPGGANPATTAGRLGIFDWKERKTVRLEEPLADNHEGDDIWGLAVVGQYAYGVTYASSLFFVYDLKAQKVVGTESLKGYGNPAGRRGDTCFVPLPDGKLLLAMQEGIFEIRNQKPVLIAKPPSKIMDVGDVHNGRLYFGSFNQLWSFTVPSSSQP